MKLLPSGRVPSCPRFPRLGVSCAVLSAVFLAALLLEARADDDPLAPAEEDAPALAMISDDSVRS